MKGVMNASMRNVTQKLGRPSQLKVSACVNPLGPNQQNQLRHDESIMGEKIRNQEMFVSSELDHNESVVDNEIDNCLLLVKSQSELSMSPTKFSDDLSYHHEAVMADQVTKMEQAHFKLH